VKVCITAMGETIEDPVDPSFGRAAYFLFYDLETEDLKDVSNDPGAHGAGVQAAGIVAENGAKAVITGSVGPNAHQGLSAAGIKIYTGAKGTAKEALADYRAGRLTLATGPTGARHKGGRI